MVKSWQATDTNMIRDILDCQLRLLKADKARTEAQWQYKTILETAVKNPNMGMRRLTAILDCDEEYIQGWLDNQPEALWEEEIEDGETDTA